MEDLTLSILQVHNTTLNASVTSGIPLNRWIIAEVMMIQEEPNNPKINKLRVLHKLEAGYNLVLKYHWPHQTTHYAEKNNLLGENQWGTRPRRSADTITLIDELINEIHRILYRSLATLQNDAAACFDRMIRNLSKLCSIFHYVPDSVCRLQANALNRMQYKIRTIHGTSSKTYSNSTEIHIHNQGQGTGSTGTTWEFHSIAMMRVIDFFCSGCVISSPNQLYQLKKHVLGFVDDKRQYSND